MKETISKTLRCIGLRPSFQRNLFYNVGVALFSGRRPSARDDAPPSMRATSWQKRRRAGVLAVGPALARQRSDVAAASPLWIFFAVDDDEGGIVNDGRIEGHVSSLSGLGVLTAITYAIAKYPEERRSSSWRWDPMRPCPTVRHTDTQNTQYTFCIHNPRHQRQAGLISSGSRIGSPQRYFRILLRNTCAGNSQISEHFMPRSSKLEASKNHAPAVRGFVSLRP